jgi:hypothetical protein
MLLTALDPERLILASHLLPNASANVASGNRRFGGFLALAILTWRL